MSIDNCAKFLESVPGNAGLEEELRSSLEQHENLERFVALGRENGHEFSSEDAVRCLAMVEDTNGELSDAALKDVAGGGISRFTSFRTSYWSQKSFKLDSRLKVMVDTAQMRW